MVNMYSSFCTPTISSTSTVLLKFGRKASLKKPRKFNLSPRREPWRFWGWLRGLFWGHAWSREQQIDKELRGHLIVVKEFWRISRLCVARHQRFFPSSHTYGHGHGPTCWALDMMVLMTRLSPRASVKAVPLQAWSGPDGSRKLSFPDFITAQEGGKVVSLTHWTNLPPGNPPGTYFC